MSAKCNFEVPRNQCTLETCCLERQAFIDYQPTIGGNAAYAGLFAAILLAQTVLLVLNRKTWGFFIGMACALVLEIVGYIGRIMLHNNPFSLNNFVIYLVCLTIGPAFMMASIYLLMGRVVVAYGTHHSLVKPFYYSLICMFGDLISLVLQAAGGAIAATGAKGSGDQGQTDNGTHIMVAGLAFQLFSTVVFGVLCAFLFASVLRNKQDRNPRFAHVTSSWRFKGMLGAVLLATITIFIRSAFRVDELKDGFGSAVANDEKLFMVFEGPMLIIAGLALTIFYPGWSFQGTYGDANWGVSSSNEKNTVNPSQVEMLPSSASGSYKGAIARIRNRRAKGRLIVLCHWSLFVAPLVCYQFQQGVTHF